ncbi:hypothetical protein [Tunturiibacter psychrotolerans]|uniref:hypothetical protein n=1 Tax=Tunturiibacter psychrotolerans TaxID=3069686 RepID=UPI003D1D3E53
MTDTRRIVQRATFAVILFPFGLLAQSVPTATQSLQLSTFLIATETSSGFQGAKSFDITSGGNLTLLMYRYLNTGVEVRGSYPIHSGSVIGQKSILVGPKFEYPKSVLRPYADLLVGRGRISYLDGGYVAGTVKYIRSDSAVFSPGIGCDLYLTHRIAMRVDIQYQSWDSPAASSGRITPGLVSVGGTYNFDFNSRHLE